jgi:hypothetical protein
LHKPAQVAESNLLVTRVTPVAMIPPPKEQGCRPGPEAESMRAVCCLLALATVSGCGKWSFRWRHAPPPSVDGLAVGSKAPEIQGQDVAGVPFKLSDYRGQIVILDFWGEW